MLERFKVKPFSSEDLERFFEQRIQDKDLSILMNASLRERLIQQTHGNPLLLDMALQTLKLTDAACVLEVLSGDHRDLETLHQRMLTEYYHVLAAEPECQTVLHYLAIACNGLFEDLLRALDPEKGDSLVQKLQEMEDLPFMKVRDVYVYSAEKRQKIPRKTYFLHDEVYRLFDGLVGRAAIEQTSRKILEYYDQQMVRVNSLGANAPRNQIQDLMVEVLLYRLRSDVRLGYDQFLLDEDYVIRSSLSIGLDIRLRDAMSTFLTIAGVEINPTSEGLVSAIDRDYVKNAFPNLDEYFRIDSGTLWVKRTSSRGDHKQAVEIGRKLLPEVDTFLYQDPQAHAVTAGEFYLWFGQALMYLGETPEAEKIYKAGLKVMDQAPLGDGEGLSTLELAQAGLVLGRIDNNLGYLFWMNMGKYHQALRFFQQAIRWLRKALDNTPRPMLQEEYANASDNLGRVYSVIGFHRKAIDLIRAGLEERKKTGLRLPRSA
ncbi:MAG: tetratricopeptide repeat protein [Anaerolineales bacterium]|nr:tetratricopeptide repeat protein [Anaerolineales bacterium]